MDNMVFNTNNLALYSFFFIIISALYLKLWFWFYVQYQVAAKILQDTATGKNYTADKVNLSLLHCQCIRNLRHRAQLYRVLIVGFLFGDIDSYDFLSFAWVFLA